MLVGKRRARGSGTGEAFKVGANAMHKRATLTPECRSVNSASEGAIWLGGNCCCRM